MAFVIEITTVGVEADMRVPADEGQAHPSNNASSVSSRSSRCSASSRVHSHH